MLQRWHTHENGINIDVDLTSIINDRFRAFLFKKPNFSLIKKYQLRYFYNLKAK
jgi:hypothetical protein